MGFARTHKRLLVAIFLIDIAATAYWWLIPFEENSLSGVVFYLAGYLFVAGLNEPLALAVIFLISYMEMLLIALAAQACWKAIRSISPL